MQHFRNIPAQFTNTDTWELNPIGGGSINQVFLCQSKAGQYVLKVNDKNTFPGMFEAEAKGLKLLGSSGVLTVPSPLLVTADEQFQFLLLEYIESGKRKPDFFFRFGVQLAKMHRNTSDSYGLDHSNYMGSLPQENTPCKTWEEFFLTQRLLPLAQKASVTISAAQKEKIREICKHVSENGPSLLHGDLWSGNFIVARDSHAAIIDPAVYFGCREVDIAMTRLFGGFEEDFYRGYNSEWKLTSGWEDRLEVWNLYPILVHAVLFGGGYADQARRTLSRL